MQGRQPEPAQRDVRESAWLRRPVGWQRALCVALGSAAALGLATAAGAADAASKPDEPTALAAALSRSLDARALRGARVGVLVVDASDGRVVFARHPDRPLVPASNQKILTAIAALRVFGPSHRFATRVFADAPPDAEGAVGQLYIKAGGDPGLTSEDLWRLAADLRRLGLRRVRGDLVIDDALFDGERWHPSWLPVSARAYHAPVSAFSVNYGSFAVVVESGAREGEPVRIAIDPPVDFFQVSNQARTSRAGSRSRLVVDRRANGQREEVVVGGEWPQGREKTFHRSVLDPTGYAASVLRLQLEGLGISVDGGTRRAYLPENAVELLEFEGRPVSDVVRRFLKYSSNSIGEGLIKALAVAEVGAPGSWPVGIGVVRHQLEALGLPTEGLVIADGSGLSYDNRVSPRQLVSALRRARSSFRFGAELIAGLPIGGSDGTLAKRAEEAHHWLRAKTGLLTRVTGLSGLAHREDGSTLAFSILVNGFRGSADQAMDAVDGFAAVLVGELAGQEELSRTP